MSNKVKLLPFTHLQTDIFYQRACELRVSLPEQTGLMRQFEKWAEVLLELPLEELPILEVSKLRGYSNSFRIMNGETFTYGKLFGAGRKYGVVEYLTVLLMADIREIPVMFRGEVEVEKKKRAESLPNATWTGIFPSPGPGPTATVTLTGGPNDWWVPFPMPLTNGNQP